MQAFFHTFAEKSRKNQALHRRGLAIIGLLGLPVFMMPPCAVYYTAEYADLPLSMTPDVFSMLSICPSAGGALFAVAQQRNSLSTFCAEVRPSIDTALHNGRRRPSQAKAGGYDRA